MLYELIKLRKTFEQRTVLDLERVQLEKGKIIGLLGPNGAGKTTLLKILAFLLPPSSGELWYEGRRVDFSSGRLIQFRRRVVLVQQQPILFTTTVKKNLELPLRIRKVPRARRRRIVEELLDLVGMRAFGQARAHKLSAGETQRVALAQALACEPDGILLDEPTANVDVENQIIIERLIQDINRKKGISVILSTHNMTQASRLADETIFLSEGRSAQSTHENIFGGRLETDARGGRCCILPGGLRLRVQSEKEGTVRLRIDPSAIELSRAEDGARQENTFRGRLTQLTDERDRVRALVDVGIPLSVSLPKETLGELRLNIGDEVLLTCPAYGIEIF